MKDYFTSAWTYPLDVPAWADPVFDQFKIDVVYDDDDSFSIWTHPSGRKVIGGITKEEAFSHAKALKFKMNRIINVASGSAVDFYQASKSMLDAYAHDEFMLPMPLGRLSSSNPTLQTIPTLNGRNVFHGRVPPIGPVQGTVFVDTARNTTSVYDGGIWKTISVSSIVP